MEMRGPEFAPQEVARDVAADGTIYVRSTQTLGTPVKNTGVWLDDWAERTPDAVFIAERSGHGWRRVTYAEARDQVHAIAAALLERGLGPDHPIALLSGNGVDHGLLTLAAQYVGVPTAPIAEQYSLIHGAHNRLRGVLEKVRPTSVFVADAQHFAEALRLDVLSGVEIIASAKGSFEGKVTPFKDLTKGGDSAAVAAAHDKVGPETIAKYLFTSGSTSSPKGVVTTQGMMCVNQVQIAQAWPFLKTRPPRIVDWLPWNHVFGGSHNFYMMLANGGSLYIDHGRPTAAGFAESIRNIREIGCTISFNVPVAYAMLAKAMETDRELRRAFFAEQDILFYAGASLPADIWAKLKHLSIEERGIEPTLVSSWGMTETAPATLLVHEHVEQPGIIGVPVAGVTVKLLPDDDMRCELRIKGPNIMDTYLLDPEKTRESFDEDGYLITGDAVRFVDDADPARGFRFDGRVSEDFKLLTGTWVHASKIRLTALEGLAGIASDVVVTGHDRGEIGVLIFPDRSGLERLGVNYEVEGEALFGEELASIVRQRLEEMSHSATGSSTLIRRALVMASPPDVGVGEITDKGSINQRKVLTMRAPLVDRLYDDGDPATIKG